MLCVLTEGDKACKRCDERARAADIHTEEQLTVIFRKLREQDRRGYVADELAGKRAEDERIFFKQDLKHRANQGDARHIARKDEKENKGYIIYWSEKDSVYCAFYGYYSEYYQDYCNTAISTNKKELKKEMKKYLKN